MIIAKNQAEKLSDYYEITNIFPLAKIMELSPFEAVHLACLLLKKKRKEKQIAEKTWTPCIQFLKTNLMKYTLQKTGLNYLN